MRSVTTVAASLAVACGAMGIAHLRLRAAQKRRSQLHRARTEHESGGGGAAIGNATGSDYRNLHGIDNLRQQCEKPRLHADTDAGEGRAVAAGLDPLRDDRVDAALFELARLGNRRCTRNDERAGRLQRLDNLRLRQTEMKTHDLGLCFEQQRHMRGSDLADGALRLRDRPQPVGVVL